MRPLGVGERGVACADALQAGPAGANDARVARVLVQLHVRNAHLLRTMLIQYCIATIQCISQVAPEGLCILVTAA